MGIPPDRIAQMFELFAQGDNSLARSEGGLGIGLTPVRSIVEQHGGNVEGRSEGQGQGQRSRIVRLPSIASAVGHTAGQESPLPSAAQSRRVILIEHNRDMALTLERLVRTMGHDVHVAHSGLDGLELARTHRPEVVLLDIGLPGMDGYEVARRLRAGADSADIRIIAISGYGRDEDRRMSAEAGIDHHLVKPVSTQALAGLLSG